MTSYMGMTKLLAGAAVVLTFGGVGLCLAPTASAGPFCDFFDVAGVCDVRDAIKACSEYPQACEQYSTPSVEPSPRTSSTR